MPLIYKTIFEIKLFHEYFLTSRDGSTIFEQPTPGNRLEFLLKEFSNNEESVNAHIDFKFPKGLEDVYDSYNLKLVPSYSGCKVAMRVQRVTLTDPDPGIVYRPLGKLSNDLDIFIIITKKTSLFDRYTSGNLENHMPGIYFFSNESTIGSRTFPFLTHDVPERRFTYPYEQGELASFGPGDTREFYRDTGGEQWIRVSAPFLANESDRLLLPTKFHYKIDPAAAVTQAEWILKDPSGNVVKSISANEPEPLTKTLLDFSGVRDAISFSTHIPTPAAFHTLEVRGNNSFSRNHRVLFNDAMHDRANWGIVHIKINPTNNAFRLIDDDGFIHKRKKPPTVDIPHRIFEIPVKSRSAYWRFINDRQKPLELINDLTEFLTKEEGNLVTIRPRPLTRDYFHLKSDTTSLRKYVPNPDSYMLNKDNKTNKIYFDIRIPESALFPVT